MLGGCVLGGVLQHGENQATAATYPLLRSFLGRISRAILFRLSLRIKIL